MNVQSDIDTMRTALADVEVPATFLDQVLATTGVTITAGEKKIILLTQTREQIMTRFVTEATD